MEEVKFEHYLAKIIRSDYRGSCKIYDEKKALVAKSEGISMKKRYISYQSLFDNFSCKIRAHAGRQYSFEVAEETQALLIPQSYDEDYSHLELIRNGVDNLTFISEGLGKNYLIGVGRIHVGIIACTDWLKDDVKIRISDPSYRNLIFCTIAAMGHRFNFLRFFS